MENLNNRFNLLYLIDSLSIGGAERLVVDSVNYLVQNYPDINVHVVTIMEGDGDLVGEISPKVKYSFINCGNKNFFGGIKKLRKYILDNNITHVHCHLYNSMVVGRLASGKSHKLFFTYHNMEYDPKDIFYSHLRVMLDKYTFKQRYISIHDSKQVMAAVHKSRGAKGNEYILYNFPSEKFSATYNFNPASSLKLVSVGSLKPVKNFDFLLQCFIELKDDDIHLDLYSDGESRDLLQRIIMDNDLKKVRLCGRQPIDSKLLSAYDMFVMSSHSEGMPVALVEAMAVGLPSMLPDHLQVMQDVAGRSAKYYSIKDKESFKVAVKDLCANKEQLFEMSKEAIERSKEFTIHNHFKKLLEIYLS